MVLNGFDAKAGDLCGFVLFYLFKINYFIILLLEVLRDEQFSRMTRTGTNFTDHLGNILDQAGAFYLAADSQPFHLLLPIGALLVADVMYRLFNLPCHQF